MTSGRRNSWENRSHAFMGISTILVPPVCRVLSPTSRPSIWLSKSGRSSAMRSMTFVASASSAVMETLSITADLAHPALRCRLSAMDFAKVEVSFSIFCFITSSDFSTLPLAPSSTGCAAPMRVCGAMAAMSAAMVMNTPALPARAGAGAT